MARDLFTAFAIVCTGLPAARNRPPRTPGWRAADALPGGANRRYIVGGLAIAVLILGLIIGWIALLRIGLFALSVLAASATVLFAWRAWGSPTRSEDQYGYGTLATMSAIGLIGCLLACHRMGVGKDPPTASPKPESSGRPVSQKALATSGYWRELWRILNGIEQPKSNVQKPTLAALSMSMSQYTDTLQNAAGQIDRLSVLHVDQDAVDLGSRYAELLRQDAVIIFEVAVWAGDRQRLDDYSVSVDASIEAFVRGFLGDPLGKAGELQGEYRQLELRRQQLFSRFIGFQENANQLQGEMQRLRARLTARYECEFLPLPNRMET